MGRKFWIDREQLKICKIEFESKVNRDKILDTGYIKIGLFDYKVENVVKVPVRCHICKAFGHTIINCKEKEICAKCSGEHASDKCSNANVT